MLQTAPLRTTALAALMAIPAPLLATTAALAEDVVFQIQNNTSAAIVEFYISPITSTSWEDNVVPEGQSLPPGEMVNMTVVDGSPDCRYDMLALFSDGGEVSSFDVNICEVEVWTYSEE
ncbi:hypothetical protein [Leptolyngbya sp. PCC 6406]|uniref:hypothetical protein n=1 Tax=Leptolyngbya sp. PCC 6406 TaxID=1173264 RepID=UPI0002ABBDA1|nr:hypothetical protein [Leptolyngbya sp. PCC 6406]